MQIVCIHCTLFELRLMNLIDFLDCEERLWNSEAIFDIRIAKGFHSISVLHLFTVFILELLPYRTGCYFKPAQSLLKRTTIPLDYQSNTTNIESKSMYIRLLPNSQNKCCVSFFLS